MLLQIENPSLIAVFILEKTRLWSRTGKKQEVSCLPRVKLIRVPLCPAVARALSPRRDRGWWPEQLGGTRKSHPGLSARLLLAHRRGCCFDMQTEANLLQIYFFINIIFFSSPWAGRKPGERRLPAPSRRQRSGERVPSSGQRGWRELSHFFRTVYVTCWEAVLFFFSFPPQLHNAAL